MRIPSLRKKIIRNCVIASILLVALAAVFNFFLNQKNNLQIKIEETDSEINRISGESEMISSKAAEVKKYKEIWQNLPEKRTTLSPIKADDLNAKINSIAQKYSIGNLSVKISLPEPLAAESFKRDTVDVMLSNVNLEFVALNDVKAISFVSELIDSLQGYPVVSYFEVKKGKDYDDRDFENIASGKEPGTVSGRLDFFWYVHREKIAQNNSR